MGCWRHSTRQRATDGDLARLQRRRALYQDACCKMLVSSRRSRPARQCAGAKNFERARVTDVLDLTTELEARLKILVQAVARLPGVRQRVDWFGLAADLLLPEQIERMYPVQAG